MITRYAHIVGWGCYLPDRTVTNDELSQLVDTSDEWIYQRTGIRTRHIAAAHETTATLAFEAAARALAVADLHPSQVELIIVATSTPEYMFPATACLVQDYLGATKAAAFDLSAACSGFVYALQMAAQSIATGSARNAIVIGSETMSRVLDWSDRGTCVLFGDGAGAVVLKGSSIPGGVMATMLRSDGSGSDLLSLPALYHNPVPMLGTEFSSNGHHKNIIDMDGRQVYRFATNVIASSIQEVLKQAELTVEDIALIIPHQANTRIIETAAKKLKVPMEKFYLNVEHNGNTSAASIPLALCDAVREGRLKPDDNVVFVGFGGGLTWGASVVKWDVSPQEVSFVDHEWKRVRYMMARGRSRLRRLQRRVEATLSGNGKKS
ncbi:MAG: ketoacyl-ACP synthase III [Candidatus Promineofilum sp.]|nr:ketoacyl-ACP synthase III [Promineifilum sp.]MBP9657687.1 ketoacyl-ACP synthase III [Promineifilum sp.]